MIMTSFYKEIHSCVAIGFRGEEARPFAERIREEMAWLLEIDVAKPQQEKMAIVESDGEVRVAITLSPAMEKLWRAVIISIIRSLSRYPVRTKNGVLVLLDRSGRTISEYAFQDASDLDLISNMIEAQIRTLRKEAT